MEPVIIVSAVRTCIGRFGGTLTAVPAVDLATCVVRAALERCKLEAGDVEEVILGQVLQAGTGLNVARQVALAADMPHEVPAFTVNKVCASGLKAVELGGRSIACGDSRIVVAGGTENMSAAPYLHRQGRWGQRLGDGELSDCILSDALTDPTHGCHMGITAENVAEKHGITRAEQDAFAAGSQQKAARAWDAGCFDAETVDVMVPQKKGEPVAFRKDEFMRPETTVEVLAALRPAFKRDGTVTAGNASGINDGAACVVLMAEGEATRRGIRGLGRLVASASAGVDPLTMGMGPGPASRKVFERTGFGPDSIDAVELNEAFAAQSIAVIRELGLNPDVTNMNGGAIALGHPVGASGARILVTLLHLMQQRGLERGLATLCVGGGQGMAMVVENAAGQAEADAVAG